MEKKLREIKEQLRCVEAINNVLLSETKELKATCLALALELAGKPSNYGLAKQRRRINLLEQRVVDLQGHDDLSYIDRQLSEQESE